MLENSNITISISYEDRHLPLNIATANAVHQDLDLQFQGHEF